MCPLCLARCHRKHEYLDLEVKRESEVFLAKIESLKIRVRHHREKLVCAKHEVQEQKASCVEVLQRNKEENIKRLSSKYNMLINKAVKEQSKLCDQLGKEVWFLDKILDAFSDEGRFMVQGRFPNGEEEMTNMVQKLGDTLAERAPKIMEKWSHHLQNIAVDHQQWYTPGNF